MTTTTIRRLPDGQWLLTQRHDTLTSLMTALDSLADLGDEVQVELPKAETWDGKWRKGDEGLLSNGTPYKIDKVNPTLPPYPLRGTVNNYQMSWTLDGQYLVDLVDGQLAGLNLMPPTKRGPKP